MDATSDQVSATGAPPSPTPPPSTRARKPWLSDQGVRIALAIAVVATLGALTVLRSEARIAESMAPVGCESGSALDLQRGPMASGDSGVRDVVSGWHLFTRLSTPAQIDPRTTLACEWPAGTAVPTAEARYSGLRAAKAWLWTDSLAFVPAYVAATVLVLVALRRRILAPRSDFAPFLRLIGSVLGRRVVFFGLVACVATAGVADQVENHVLRTRLDSWWNVLDQGPLNVPLDLTAAHVAGWLKWFLLLPPMLVVLVAAIASLFAGAVSLGRVLRDAWFQVALVVAFVAAVLLPPQSADALRRLSSGDWALTTLLVATLAAVIALSASGALAPDPPEDPTGAGRWSSISTIALGLAIGAASWLPPDHGWRGLRVPGAIVVAVGVLSFLLDLGGQRAADAQHRGRATAPGTCRARARARATDAWWSRR